MKFFFAKNKNLSVADENFILFEFLDGRGWVNFLVMQATLKYILESKKFEN